MASLFLSYSRRNLEMARRLVTALEGQGLDYWIDWEGIEPTVDWWREICRGIEEADNFLVLLSPDSARSEVCGRELEHAVRNGKRLIPVVVVDVRPDEVAPQLSALNWIFLREGDDFPAGMARLVEAIQTDYEWAQVHRRLQVKALEWERSGAESGFLLRGRDLQDAETQLAGDAQKDPCPTALQREYVRRSRQASDRQRGIGMAAASAGLLVLAAVAYFLLVRPYRLRSLAQGEMVPIAAGPVLLGTDDPQASPEETPAWAAELPGFQIDRYEVSNYRYGLCVDAGACQEPADPTRMRDARYADEPVTGVTAYQADAFCRWLGGRLPTELEWERAARGPDGRLWPWGGSPPAPATANLAFDDQAEGRLMSVAALPDGASLEGVYNLVGNVWEWTSSREGPDGGYERDPDRYWDSRLEPAVPSLIQRGGSWDDNTLERVTRRDVVEAGDTTRQVGIRCARSS